MSRGAIEAPGTQGDPVGDPVHSGEAAGTAAAPPAVGFAPTVALVVGKDLRVELRSREIIYTMVFFAVMVVLIFSFAFLRDGRPVADLAAGILWVAIAFAGTLGLGRFFEREREGDTMRALLLTPAPRSALYLGKLAGILCFMLLCEGCTVPLLALLFDQPLFGNPLQLVALLLLGSLGFAAVGSLFGAALLRARSRDVLLPVLLYPLVVPVVIAGTKGTAALLESPPALGQAIFWIKFLAVFDVLFLTLALWVFEPLLSD
jgi:heme exporter protein CcmB